MDVRFFLLFVFLVPLVRAQENDDESDLSVAAVSSCGGNRTDVNFAKLRKIVLSMARVVRVILWSTISFSLISFSRIQVIIHHEFIVDEVVVIHQKLNVINRKVQ